MKWLMNKKIVRCETLRIRIEIVESLNLLTNTYSVGVLE